MEDLKKKIMVEEEKEVKIRKKAKELRANKRKEVEEKENRIGERRSRWEGEVDRIGTNRMATKETFIKK